MNDATTITTQAAEELTAPTQGPRTGLARRGIAVLLVLGAAISAMLGLASTASASAALDGCDHGSRAVLTLTMPSAANYTGLVDDAYLYHWNGSSWAYTGVVSRRIGANGFWQTPSGGITQINQFTMARNSGYYLVWNRVWSPSTGLSNAAWIYGYRDDLRGAQTYCLA